MLAKQTKRQFASKLETRGVTMRTSVSLKANNCKLIPKIDNQMRPDNRHNSSQLNTQPICARLFTVHTECEYLTIMGERNDASETIESVDLVQQR